MSAEELVETYIEFLTKRKESCLREEKQKIISSLLMEKEKLVSTIAGLEYEILLNVKLESIPEHVQMINNSFEEFDDVCEEKMKDIGFNYNSMNKKIK